jgi:hypothetical protein
MAGRNRDYRLSIVRLIQPPSKRPSSATISEAWRYCPHQLRKSNVRVKMTISSLGVIAHSKNIA